jgi:hypothetical protein
MGPLYIRFCTFYMLVKNVHWAYVFLSEYGSHNLKLWNIQMCYMDFHFSVIKTYQCAKLPRPVCTLHSL